uniref:Small subunit processome component 20 homolog n=1 Tax=Macrostomum lignano TaxID=282301 RepID=A0A1I8I4S2_9PLAT
PRISNKFQNKLATSVMDSYFKSLDLLTREEHVDNKIMDELKTRFPSESVSQYDVKNLLLAMTERFSSQDKSPPDRHSPGHYVVTRFVVHIRDVIYRNKSWQKQLRGVIWDTFCTLMVGPRLSGFLVDLMSELTVLSKHDEDKFEDPDCARKLLLAIKDVRIEEPNTAEAEDEKDRAYAVSRLRDLTVTFLLSKFSEKIYFEKLVDTVKSFYLNLLETCDSSTAKTEQYRESVLAALHRKLSQAAHRPLCNSIVHMYANDQAFMRSLLGVLDNLANRYRGRALSKQTAGTVGMAMLKLGSSVQEVTNVDFTYLIDDAHRICLCILASNTDNEKLIDRGKYLLVRLYDFAVRAKLSLKVRVK